MATGAGIASTGLGIFQTVSSMSRAKKAEEAIKNFKRQELINPFKNIQISTLKSDQETEANLSRFATSVDTLQRGGTRAVFSGLPKITESNILLQNLISQDLEKQDLDRSFAIAEGEEDIREIQENREINALLGLGQSLQTGRQDAMSGISNIFSSGMALTSALDLEGLTPEQKTAKTLARRKARENRLAIRNA